MDRIDHGLPTSTSRSAQSHLTARPTGPGNANHTARPCLVLPNTRRPVIAPTASPPSARYTADIKRPC
ncbi:hypothetical protein CCHR01_15401 [Colletotrichum chrysophilum]|uniref:Uncharacterized protein n=1 Tax=Colletotrichum chrysophilum TaxID=1836956 RepID=A0AAD9A7R3_9PEZI|nr:hypothetical protein CCHR01_15401 [Colletotrichum chrysophilum]